MEKGIRTQTGSRNGAEAFVGSTRPVRSKVQDGVDFDRPNKAKQRLAQFLSGKLTKYLVLDW